MHTSLFNSLDKTRHVLEQFQCIIGALLRWFVLAMAITVGIIVTARQFDIGSTALQESISYMHAMVFMLCCAYTAQVDGHVRVDIFYRRFTHHQRAWVDTLGNCIFLLPFAVFLTLISLNAAMSSWEYREASTNPGGLPFVYILKSLAPATGILLIIHMLANTLRQLSLISLETSS